MGQPAPVCCRYGRNGDTPGDHMKAHQGEVEDTQTPSLDDRVHVLERELKLLQRLSNRRDWMIEALLVVILLEGVTAWILFKG